MISDSVQHLSPAKRTGVSDAGLRAALERVLTEYPGERSRSEFARNDLAAYVRTELPSRVKAITPNPSTYLFKGSAGTGNWADCPWAAVMDPDVTTTVQAGFYPVLLFSENGSRVYLSLNQGVTRLLQEHGAKQARAILARRSALYSSLLGSIPSELDLTGPIDLCVSRGSSSASYYELGHVCGVDYPASALPSDDRIAHDFRLMIDTYQRLAAMVDPEIEPEPAPSVGDEDEDYTRWRIHKRLDRNASLAAKVKLIHGYRCQACGIDMEDVYGAIGHRYIEAHHLVPVAELHGRVIRRNPRTDFAVLCPNCHRMIHRSGAPHDVESLSKRVHAEVVDF